MKRVVVLMSMVFFVFQASLLWSQEVIPQGTRCTECGMTIDPESRFSSWTVDEDGKKFFCDIGDMLYYYKKDMKRIKEAHVRDFISGEWIDAKWAFYVKSEQFRTPMSWHIGAFKNRADAERFGIPYIFDNVSKLLK